MCACTSDRLRYVAQDPEKEGFFINDSSGGIEYSLLEALGYGSCATCFSATDHSDDSLVALKVIRRDVVHQGFRKYIERELSLHSHLQHPFIIGFKRVFYTDEFMVLVLEYASAGSLASYNFPVGFEERKGIAIYFFQQLICAIEYCHKHSIMHRDLKLENTLLKWEELPDGTTFLALKLADFGMCKAAVHSDPKTRVGTVPYMAPRYPYKGDNADVMVRNIMRGDIVWPAEAKDDELRLFIQSMLAPEWRRRPSIAQVKAHAVFRSNLPTELQGDCSALPTFSACAQKPDDISAVLRSTLGSSPSSGERSF